MPIETAADRLATLAGDGEAVAWATAADGAAQDIVAVFDERSERQGEGSGAGFIAEVPMLTLRTADIPSAAVIGTDSGDVVTLADGRRFRPVVHEPDGTGFSSVTLEAL